MGVWSDRPRRIQPRDLARAALAGVRLYRLRSTLTATSFAAGTAAAVALLAITGGARQELLERIQRLGANLVSVHAVGEAGREAPPALTISDAIAIERSLAFARDVAPVRVVPASVLLPDEQLTVQVVGTTPDYFALRGLSFTRGRPFSVEESDEGRAVCVVGDTTARRLAREAPVYGSLVKIGTRWCRVVGILAPETSTTGDDSDRRLYVPISTTLRRDLSSRQALGEILLRVSDDVDPERAAEVVKRTLLRRHDGVELFAIETAQALLRQQRSTRGLLDTLLAAVALLALCLGGVALGSQSWQSVSMRRREIAIRRAIGARRNEILAQFLLEGAMLAIAGAIVGATLGVVGSGLASTLGDWPWLLPTRSLAATIAAILALGIAATLYPAYRAATLDPVAALRLER